MDQLIKVLKENGIRLSTSNGKDLEVYFDQKEIPQQLAQDIRINKSALLNYLQKVNTKKKFSKIVPVPKAENYPLSSAQYRIWVISQMEGNSGAYNMSGSFPLKLTNPNSFEKAIHSAIERHEILRTVFREDETGEIKQWILSPEELNFSLDHKDFSNALQKEELINAYIAEDSFKPFDLSKGPLIRACLIRVADRRLFILL